MRPFPRRRPLPGQSRPDGLHLERVADDGTGSPVKPVPARWPGLLTPEQRRATADQYARAQADYQAVQTVPMHEAAPDAGLPGNWADSPLATRLQHHLDEITADRDALALANGRLVAKVREQDATITDLTARLEEA